MTATVASTFPGFSFLHFPFSTPFPGFAYFDFVHIFIPLYEFPALSGLRTSSSFSSLSPLVVSVFWFILLNCFNFSTIPVLVFSSFLLYCRPSFLYLHIFELDFYFPLLFFSTKEFFWSCCPSVLPGINAMSCALATIILHARLWSEQEHRTTVVLSGLIHNKCAWL